MTPSDSADPVAAAQAEAQAALAAAQEAQAVAEAAVKRAQDAAAAAQKTAAAEQAAAIETAEHTAGEGAEPARAEMSAEAEPAARAEPVVPTTEAPTTEAPMTEELTTGEPASAAAEPTAASVVPEPPATPTGDAADPTPPLDAAHVDTIRDGYTFDAPALEMGALVNIDAQPDVPIRIPLAMTNRHGLVAGATGTGKTRTLQVLAEQLSSHGVAVFAADIKGDLSGVATVGASSPKLLARTEGIGQAWEGAAFPTEYFSLGGTGKGVPIRATVAGFGPILLSKVLGLNDTQESSLGLVFHYADKAGLPLLDLTDLRAVLSYLISDDGKGELTELGGLSSATVGVILRELITFADQGADVFFGEPEIDTAEFLKTTADGKGVISLLEVPGVQDKPALYSTFLMWLLADLFNDLPEVGDLDKPKLVFFFDEAHLLFTDASKDFLAAITQTVRLIRSKGVGIFFVTQSPKDVPSDVLAQLGSRVQHQLRAFTPDDAKALRQAVSTYPNSGYDLEEVLTVLGTGEAIVTVMNEKGAPSPVAWTRLRAPQGSMAPTSDAEIDAAVAASPLLATYGTAVDRDSAREMLAAKLEAANAAAEAREAELDRAEAAAELEKQQAAMAKQQAAAEKKAQAEYDRLMKRTSRSSTSRTTSRPQKSVLEQVLGSSVTKTILTGVVTGIFGTRRRR